MLVGLLFDSREMVFEDGLAVAEFGSGYFLVPPTMMLGINQTGAGPEKVLDWPAPLEVLRFNWLPLCRLFGKLLVTRVSRVAFTNTSLRLADRFMVDPWRDRRGDWSDWFWLMDCGIKAALGELRLELRWLRQDGLRFVDGDG